MEKMISMPLLAGPESNSNDQAHNSNMAAEAGHASWCFAGNRCRLQFDKPGKHR
jgi:hypothetical protein